jgi:hypothetical protein
MTSFVKSVLFYLALAETTAFAQRLVIESPAAGPFTRVIYGKVSQKQITVFEKAFNFEIESNSTDALTDNSPDGTSTSGASTQKQSKPIALTSFTLKPDDLPACVTSPRFKGFRELANALKPKINSVSISASADAAECAVKIAKALSNILTDAEITNSNADTDGVRVELGVTTPIVVDSAKSENSLSGNTAPVNFESFDDLVKGLTINIGDQLVKPNKAGYFAAEFESSAEVPMVIKLIGRKTIRTTTFPALIGQEAAPVARGEGYAARLAEFSKPKLNVVISETPFLAKKTTLDGGLGGGYGYGRQIPGEKRGQRMVTLLGIERRGIFGDFGARGGLFYTRAPSTVVPQTFTARASGFYDWTIIDDNLTMRFGGGFEVFSAQVKYKKTTNASATTPPAALIPQQVSAPLVSLAIHTVLFNSIVFSPTIVYTPLYVASIGFYPSVSPSLEFGYKLNKNWILMTQFGSETHRFPSVAGETKLQMDYGLITLKRGIF